MKLLEFADLSQSDLSNRVMRQVNDLHVCPPPGWDGILTRKNSFHKSGQRMDNIAVYSITVWTAKWKIKK